MSRHARRRHGQRSGKETPPPSEEKDEDKGAERTPPAKKDEDKSAAPPPPPQSAKKKDEDKGAGALPASAGERESPAGSAAHEMKKKLRSVFRRKAGTKEELAKALGRPQGKGDSRMAGWSQSSFGRTPEQLKKDLDPRRQMSWLFDQARKRPFTSMAVLMLVLLIIVGDLVAIIKRLNVTEWLGISVTLGGPAGERFFKWEKRDSALEQFKHSDEPDPLEKSAVSGEEKLPADKWEKPELSGSLAGILTPSELRRSYRGDAVFMKSPPKGYVSGMDRTRIIQRREDGLSFDPKGKAPIGVYLGEAGDLLDNYASVRYPVKTDVDFGQPVGTGKYQQVPKDLRGNELVTAMEDGTLMKKLKDYAKDGTWRLEKVGPGYKTIDAELAGLSMKNNQAVFQLLETKRATDEALYCGTCQSEKRIHDTRATFFGEKH